MFKRRSKAVDERNPMLDIPHDHDPLPANDGKERVCGLCGLRELVDNLIELKE